MFSALLSGEELFDLFASWQTPPYVIRFVLAIGAMYEILSALKDPSVLPLHQSALRRPISKLCTPCQYVIANYCTILPSVVGHMTVKRKVAGFQIPSRSFFQPAPYLPTAVGYVGTCVESRGRSKIGEKGHTNDRKLYSFPLSTFHSNPPNLAANGRNPSYLLSIRKRTSCEEGVGVRSL
jgi:hypothetical protein